MSHPTRSRFPLRCVLVSLLFPAALVRADAPGDGVYAIFVAPGLSVPRGRGYTVHAHIEDTDGNDAQGGTVVFQTCGVQQNHVGSSLCAEGQPGRWTNAVRVNVDPSGDAFVAATTEGFSIGHQLGYQYQYIAKG